MKMVSVSKRSSAGLRGGVCFNGCSAVPKALQLLIDSSPYLPSAKRHVSSFSQVAGGSGKL